MIPKPLKAQKPQPQLQAVLATIRQQMLKRLKVQPEKTIPRLADVRAQGGGGCVRWYNI